MSAGLEARTHRYVTRLVWDGNRGGRTPSYTGYDRAFTVRVAGKPDLRLTADPAFRGDPAAHNPEDLFLASVAGCHMLFYLSLCARAGIRVLSYQDEATGTLAAGPEGGRFTGITLNPIVVVAPGDDESLALRLHDTAHDRCFIANSCAVPIRHRPTVRSAPTSPGAGSPVGADR
jgi:organic hydroperoxide reductase OsmC/OhrA